MVKVHCTFFRYLRWNKVDPENPLSTEQIYFSQNNEQITGSLQGRAIIDIQDGSTQIKILNFNTSLDATTYQCIVCDTDITCQSSILDINGIELLGRFLLFCSVHIFPYCSRILQSALQMVRFNLV